MELQDLYAPAAPYKKFVQDTCDCLLRNHDQTLHRYLDLQRKLTNRLGQSDEFKCLKVALHKAKINRHTVQDEVQRALASVQPDMASGKAKLNAISQHHAGW